MTAIKSSWSADKVLQESSIKVSGTRIASQVNRFCIDYVKLALDH